MTETTEATKSLPVRWGDAIVAWGKLGVVPGGLGWLFPDAIPQPRIITLWADCIVERRIRNDPHSFTNRFSNGYGDHPDLGS